jgi:hypothetical protein
MEALITFFTALAGMTFSLAIGVLMEELIFAKLFCPLFARQAAQGKSRAITR